MPFFAVAALAALAWIATILWVPRLPVPAAGPAGTQLAALAQPPILTDITGFSIRTVSLLLVVSGVATLVGNFAGGRWAVSLGWPVALGRMLAGLLVVLAALALAADAQESPAWPGVT